MRRIAVLQVLLILLLSVGCSSLSTWVRSNLEGVPAWVYEPQAGRNQSAFVGTGTAATETRARVLSHESILRQISVYIGEDVSDRYLAELTSRGAIETYRLRVTQEYVKRDGDTATVYLLALADTAALETARTEAEVLLLEKQEEMRRLTDAAAQAFRGNRDVRAAGFYLETALIAASLPSGRSSGQYRDAVNRVQSILEALVLSASAGDPSVPSTVVTLKRGSRAISPRVAGASVTAYAKARDGLGLPYDYRQVFVTDSSGQFTYHSDNPGIVGIGELVFGIELSDALDRLSLVDPGKSEELKLLLRSKRITYPYRRISPMEGRGVLIAVSEYSRQGGQLGTAGVADRMIDMLGLDGLSVDSAMVHAADDEEEFLAALRTAYPGHAYVVMGKAGVSHVAEVAGEVNVTVEGEVSLVDIRTQTGLGSTGIVRANASASTQEDATRKAFEQFGTMAASLASVWFYR